jgi:hypothetical protein
MRTRGHSRAVTAAVTVAGEKVTLASDAGQALVEDLTRYAEQLIDDEELRAAWGMSTKELAALKNDPAVFEAVQSNKNRREQDGSAAREAARKAFIKAPRVLEHILADPHTPARARIEASRELRSAAGFPFDQQSGRGGEVLHVTINLGADEEPLRFKGFSRKSPHPDDIDLLDLPPARDRVLIPPEREIDDDDH